MSTLVLQAAGSAIGAAVGGPVGAMVGQALGAMAGASIDSKLFAGPAQPVRHVEGPRLKTLSGLSSTEGAPIPRVYGRVRIGGEIIWATRFIEEVSYRTSGGGRRGGKGGGGGGGGEAPVTVTTTYSYAANLAIGLCEGPIGFVRRIWADGRELDLTTLNIRVHPGDERQDPDPLIVAKEGAAGAPAYRGLAYVVLENFQLGPFGNRLPQISFEVVRPVPGLGSMIRAMNVIPGAGEFVYQPTAVNRVDGLGSSNPMNRHVLSHGSDWAASMDQLQALCPNLERVGLVVSWFGDDLRAGDCTITLRAETATRTVDSAPWTVAGLSRTRARTVSQIDGNPAYGGTPSDASVIAAIRDLKARGLAVTLYPFVMMDVPAANPLPDPWSGVARQPAYPWRGRITCHPAPGRPGTPDATAAAAAQVSAFFGTAVAGHFSIEGQAVVYSGPDEWRFRRHILHCAALAKAAGGVDAFLIGSELAGLTHVRSGPGAYPAAAQLASLAASVRALLGASTRISYAADWTEYGGHVPAPGELRFPLDPLWSSPAIDAVSIDVWWPFADWRDGPLHADAPAARSPWDADYLLANTARGEGYDWYYADHAGRSAQVRLPISDGAAGKPFVYRPKDLVGWWSNPHVERAAGVELPGQTGWVPRSKPIWLTEVGCPAVDKGANAPNAFPDPKSAQASLPYYSRGLRDDLMQARGVEAILTRFDPSQRRHPAGSNPVSPVYGGTMVDPGRVHVWAWDARPYPAFPMVRGAWSDADAWSTGHWLTGRLEGMPVEKLVDAVLAELNAAPAARMEIDGFVDGYVIDRPMSVRAALEPIAGLFGFDAISGSDGIRFAGRTGAPVRALGVDDLIPDKQGDLVRRVRAQESELPHEISLSFVDAELDHTRATVFSRRLAGGSRRSRNVEVAAVLRRSEAGRLADIALHDAWVGREKVEFAVRPGLIALEVGDAVTIPALTGSAPLRIERIRDADTREITARTIEPSLCGAPARASSAPSQAAPSLPGKPFAQVFDWPLAAADPAPLQSLAVSADPWPGQMAIWRSADGSSFDLLTNADVAATIGQTVEPFPAGPVWRFDNASALTVQLARGSLVGPGDMGALDPSAPIAVLGPDGAWEVVAYARAELVAARTWRLSRLIRGLGGSEPAASRPAPIGSRVVVLDKAPVTVASGAESLGRTWRYRIGPAGRDVADASMLSLEATPVAAALLPLSPVRVAAKRVGAGIEISWLRRARTGADAWEPVEIPLGEDQSSFVCEILSGFVVRRSLATASSPALYAAGDEIADFGQVQAGLSLRVMQLSAAAGRGRAFSGFVPVR